ncbi:unnamed protein product [Prunus armeniaca]
MASSSSYSKHFNLNVAPKATRDTKEGLTKRLFDDSMAFSICSAASISNLARRLLARRMLQDSQQEVENLKQKNKALSKLVGSYPKDMQTKLDMLQSSNENILEDQERVMVEVKRPRSPSPKTSKP